MYGQGHYFCQNCGHAVYARYGGCRTCRTPLSALIALDMAYDRGWASPGIGFDPFDGEVAFNIPGTDLAIEPDGQLDVNVGGVDVPLDGGFGGNDGDSFGGGNFGGW